MERSCSVLALAIGLVALANVAEAQPSQTAEFTPLNIGGHVLPVPLISQRTNVWCWAASGEMVEMPAKSVLVAAGTSPNIMYEKERPGTFALDKEIAALEAVTLAGGFSATAAPAGVKVLRRTAEGKQDTIALDLAGVAVSTGSACSSGTLEPSHVLKAMGFPAHRTQNSIRFSLGSANTEADIDRVIAVLPGIVEKLRSLTRSPVGSR